MARVYAPPMASVQALGTKEVILISPIATGGLLRQRSNRPPDPLFCAFDLTLGFFLMCVALVAEFFHRPLMFLLRHGGGGART